MSKHTKGPWFTSQPHQTIYIEARIGGGLLQEVAAIGPTEGGPLQQSANARLIAAAPDLLEACQTFAEWLRREDAGFVKAGNSRETPEGEAEWRAWFLENMRICALAQDQARAAIAKATEAA